VNALIYTIGDKVDDVLNSLQVSEEKQNDDYDELRKAFDEHFIGVHNVNYEKLAEHCKYGTLHKEMIRDRDVVGIRDATLSEKLQLNPNLDLATVSEAAGGGEKATSCMAVSHWGKWTLCPVTVRDILIGRNLLHVLGNLSLTSTQPLMWTQARL